MELPLVLKKTEGVKEEELRDLRLALSEAKEVHGIEKVYTGALASVYQKTRVESTCKDLGLTCASPLWGVDQEEHLRRLVKDGFRVMVVSVSALGLDQSWLGRVIDEKAIDELVVLGRRYGFNIGFEGGEGETFVLDCPLFKRPVKLEVTKKQVRGDSGYLEILEASLVDRSKLL
jgi:diphthine-ammonia ligase